MNFLRFFRKRRRPKAPKRKAAVIGGCEIFRRNSGRKTRPKRQSGHFRKRKVTLDTNTILSGIVYDSRTCKEAISKALTEDELMLTSEIYNQCIRHGRKKKSKMSSEEIAKELERLGVRVIKIKTPPLEEMKAAYYVRDDNDYVIIFSSNVTDSEILVSGDKDFLDPDLRGLKAKVMIPADYIGKKPKGKKQ